MSSSISGLLRPLDTSIDSQIWASHTYTHTKTHILTCTDPQVHTRHTHDTALAPTHNAHTHTAHIHAPVCVCAQKRLWHELWLLSKRGYVACVRYLQSSSLLGLPVLHFKAEPDGLHLLREHAKSKYGPRPKKKGCHGGSFSSCEESLE